jgi:hypothetical protein
MCHLVAIPEDRAEENIRKFGPFTSDLHRLADWLSEHRIETVVMESTGVYCIPVFQILAVYYRTKRPFMRNGPKPPDAPASFLPCL